ncbi:MAG TPA: MFS transporter [Spirochaetes bacterium]|nr:MFS transporter [Spirochaetota bacterium]
MKVLTKEVFGWAMFDFANSSYTTVIITAIFNLYFIEGVVGDPNHGDYLWGMTLSISYLIVVLVSPILGAIADFSALKKRFLLFTSLVCVGFTAPLYFVGPGDLILAMTFVILSNIGFSMGENLISSFLPEITTKDHIGRVSGYGWGLGFLGGILALLGSIVILKSMDGDSLGYKLIYPFVALFFALSAIPTFLWVKERGTRHQDIQGLRAYAQIGYQQLMSTFRHLSDFKELVKLLFAFFFYNAGLITVIAFAVPYAKEVFGFEKGELIVLIIVSNVAASIGAILFGFIQDKIGAKRTLAITVAWWIVTVLGIYSVESQKGFWVMASMAGFGLGSAQSATRAMVGLFSPKSRLAEFYGFWGMFGKLSSILGLYSFGLLSYVTSSKKLALLSTAVFFIIGFIILLWINEKKGIQRSTSYDRDITKIEETGPADEL